MSAFDRILWLLGLAHLALYGVAGTVVVVAFVIDRYLRQAELLREFMLWYVERLKARKRRP